MFPVPSPSTGRGEVVLQPNYFTSSVYVKALRDDLSTLILKYHEAYSQSASDKPFAIFKKVWLDMGWHWLHFKVFDSRSRQTFLEVTLRLFFERTVKTEAPFTRVVSLFAAYTFFYTQIKDPVPPLHSVSTIPIPYDHYQSLLEMAENLTSQQVISFRPQVQYVISRLQKDDVFLILPKSDLGPMNPRDLPREIYADDGIVFSDPTQKRKGRPPRREKGKRARLALDELNQLLSNSEGLAGSTDLDILPGYQSTKNTLLGTISAEALQKVNHAVLARLKEIQENMGGDSDTGSIQRVEQRVAEDARGIFGLLE